LNGETVKINAMTLLSFLLRNKLLFIALAAIPLFIFFISQSDTRQKKTRALTSIQRSAGKQPPAAPNKISLSGAPQTPENMEHRIPLSEHDFYAKDKIIQLLPQNEDSGTVYQSQNVVIEYIASSDSFQVEIITADLATAKSEAVSWFTAEGLSHEGICSAGVSFYLNYSIENQLGHQADAFSPLPDGC
jgi:hypothetical protein